MRQKPISKTWEITQADNLDCRRRLSRKAQVTKLKIGRVIKVFLAETFYIDKISSPLRDDV